jgi:mono/diheme cytochrome c family protein
MENTMRHTDKKTLLGLALLLTLAARAATAQAPDGQAVFKENCKSCHGINGVPPERERAKYKKLRTLGDSGFVASLSQDSIVKIVTNGIDKNMKSFKDKLSADEIHAVAGYIKELAEKKKGG